MPASAQEPDFLPREELTAPRLAALAELDDAAFRKLFAGTAIKRIGRDRFVRNVLIAIGNADPQDPDLVAAAQRRLDDAAPLVRAAAVWAFSRLASVVQYEAERARRLSREDDPLVREEWERVRPGGGGMSPMIGRAIGVLVLCLLVGLLLTHLGIAARGILTDTWHTILSVGRLVGALVEWALPYTLLGAVIVVPLLLIGFVIKRGIRK